MHLFDKDEGTRVNAQNMIKNWVQFKFRNAYKNILKEK